MANNVNVTPGHGMSGRHPTRQFLDTLSGHDDPGMFGRMFPTLPPMAVGDAPLKELAEAMKDADPADAGGNNDKIPAGFTYLGQFVDHDISLDFTSIGEKQADPQATENFRTPALDLDSIYGLGPDGSRQLYARNGGADSGRTPGPKFLIGKTINVPVGDVTGDHRNDLPRSPEGFALIGDHRNDENLLVAQTHLAMLKFHNKVCDIVAGNGASAETVFSEARRVVTWHYQWMVLHDFVERLTEPGLVAKILHEGRQFYRFKKVPYMPVEFSGAAYRLGHSMVRQAYSHNRIFNLRRRGACDAEVAVRLHRTVRWHHWRSGAQSANRPHAGARAVEQLDHRLAALLRLWRQPGRSAAEQVAQARSVRHS